MPNAYDQLIAALRAITVQTSDPLPVVVFALQAIEQERLAGRKQPPEGIAGPSAPMSRPIRAERMS
ncbi:hypothetical protein [Methylobacterium symbioticum]|uniref:Uncharacterized protein n=1 Tax=Methylobacterium symbioticum TaxID=2584084 RepID=A0A509EIS8_9HYPH|nr:hypothetical protein [Methylobacterium symbioticum]VUD73275.1 hypothetical protein MET9862_03890 [Methylobacterium symbioticum]